MSVEKHVKEDMRDIFFGVNYLWIYIYVLYLCVKFDGKSSIKWPMYCNLEITCLFSKIFEQSTS